MNKEQLEKGNALQREIKHAEEMKLNYDRLITNGIRKDFQALLAEPSVNISICVHALSCKTLNETFHDEMQRFLEIMATKIDKHIKALELEFENLTAE